MSTHANSAIRPAAFFLCIAVLMAFSLSSNNVYSADQGSVLPDRIIKNGEKAPLFQGEELGGGNFDLIQHIGKTPVVLFFWSFFCQPCREEMPVLQKIHEDLGMDEVLFVGINLDGPKLGNAIEKFMTDSNLVFTTVFDELVDVEYKIADPYGVTGTPTAYVIDLEGNVAFSAVGRIEPEDLKDALTKSLGKGT